jgi:phage-related protein
VISKLNEEKLKDIASDFSFGYMSLKDSLSIDSLKEKIYRESQKVSLKNQEEKRIDMTRILIFFSFVFFLLYFIFANF